MYPGAKILVACAVAVVAASSSFASDNNALVIKGKVTDDNGKPANGTEVRVKAIDRTATDKVVRTDSRGQYIVLGLVPGNYSITAYDPDGVARSRAIIKTDHKGWAKVNFDLGLDSVGDDAVTPGNRQVIVTSGHARGSP